jgi:hypothetical protein
MIWFFKSWNPEIRSFDIKRREGMGTSWEILNKEPIIPSLSVKKNFLNVESEKAEASRIKSVMIQYLNQHKIWEMDSTTFLSRLATDNGFTSELNRMIYEDYDIALMSGLAYIDHSATKKVQYEYGLFVHGTDKMLADAKWIFGEVPDLNAVVDITSRSVPTKRGIMIHWTTDAKRLKSGYVHGFNLYRDGIRLNQDPIMISYNNDLSEFEWFDSTANSSIPAQYCIGSESLLDIEGTVKPYFYNPADHPASYVAAEVSNINSLGYYFKEGIQVSWKFPKEYEHFINGFYIEKDNIPAGFKQVCSVSDPSARDCVDRTSSPVNSYLRFRVMTLYKDRTVVQGPERVYSYFPIRNPPPPLSLKALPKISNNTYSLELTWDPPMQGDTFTNHYQVYFNDNGSSLMTLNRNYETVKGTHVQIMTRDIKTGQTKFCVSAIGANGSESQLSDTVTVNIPTLIMPVPRIDSISTRESMIKIYWSYPEIADLAGFRIYKNGISFLPENAIGANRRELVLNEQDARAGNEFTIKSFNMAGIESELSNPVKIPNSAPPKRKK